MPSCGYRNHENLYRIPWCSLRHGAFSSWVLIMKISLERVLNLKYHRPLRISASCSFRQALNLSYCMGQHLDCNVHLLNEYPNESWPPHLLTLLTQLASSSSVQRRQEDPYQASPSYTYLNWPSNSPNCHFLKIQIMINDLDAQHCTKSSKRHWLSNYSEESLPALLVESYHVHHKYHP